MHETESISKSKRARLHKRIHPLNFQLPWLETDTSPRVASWFNCMSKCKHARLHNRINPLNFQLPWREPDTYPTVASWLNCHIL